MKYTSAIAILGGSILVILITGMLVSYVVNWNRIKHEFAVPPKIIPDVVHIPGINVSMPGWVMLIVELAVLAIAITLIIWGIFRKPLG